VPLEAVFDALSPDQRAALFQCREMHKWNDGYFIAEALSAARSNIARVGASSGRV
jgi:hypothetical protein